jgi:probable rRNA maturation factor
MAADQAGKAGRSQGPRAQVALRVAAPRAAHAARVLRAVAADWTARVGGGELSVSLVTDREMRRINRAWRGKDKPTDVISFELGVPGGPLGEVVISLDTARRQAKEGGWPLSHELRRLLAHGIVHCRGYTHHDPGSAARMAAAERRLLAREGMVGEAFSGLRRGGVAGGASPSHKRRPARAGAPRKKRKPERLARPWVSR